MRRKFSRELKLETVKLVTASGVSVAQACRGLDVGESILRRGMRELAEAPASALPGQGQLRAEQAEIAALKKEVARLKPERDILKRRPRPSRGSRHEVRLHRKAPPYLAGELALRGVGVSRSGFHVWLTRPASAHAIADERLTGDRPKLPAQ